MFLVAENTDIVFNVKRIYFQINHRYNLTNEEYLNTSIICLE